MSDYRHKGQILPIQNQMVPISKDTKFHASYDYGLHGFSQEKIVHPIGPRQALNFNGSNRYIETNQFFNFQKEDAFSVSFWLTFEDHSSRPTAAAGLIGKGHWYVNTWDIFLTNAHEIRFEVGSAVNGEGVYMNSSPLPIQTWHYVVATYNNGRINLYINNKLAASKTHTFAQHLNNSYTVQIGRRAGDSSRALNGVMADVKIWNKELSEKEVSENTYGYNQSEGLLAYWKLNEKEGPVSYDSSGNGHDGYWVGDLTPTYGPTVAVLKNEGKFGAAVLVEEGTTNLMYGKTPTINSALISGTDGKGFYIMRPSGATSTYMGVAAPNIPIPQGGTYTFSFEFMSDISFNWTIDNNDFSDNYTGNDLSRASTRNEGTTYTTPGQWQYVSTTVTMKADALNPKGAALFGIMANNPAVDHKIYVRNLQFELINYRTSYVENKRPLGQLSYPAGLVDWTQPWTISMWVKFKNPSTVDNRLCILWSAYYDQIANNALHILRRYAEGLSIGFYGNDLTTSNYIDDTNWHHYSFIWDGSKQIIYQDGKKAAERVAIAPLNKEVNTVPHGINAYHTPATQAPNAFFDEIRIEQRAISEEEAQAWAASGLHYNYLDYSYYVD